MTRRIDELGRIVIPKEIRKNLKIRDSDELEISVKEDSIILNKFDSLEEDKIIDILLEIIYKITNKCILYTTKDKIISYKIDNNIDINNELNQSLIKIILNREVVVGNGLLPISKEPLNISYLVKPIIVNSDLLGSVILFSKKDSISELDKNIINFVVSFLEKYLE